MYKKRFGFTLAEVLLTMTIVGVVAALTIPTLHYNKTKKEYTAKLKNFYSKINNAVLDMEMDKGSFRDMVKPSGYAANYAWYMENLDPYIGHEFTDSKNYVVYYKDGSCLRTFYTGGCLDVDYDVNGDKSPNKSGYDRFRFLFCFTDANRTSWFGNSDIFFGTYGSGIDSSTTTRDAMVTKCQSSPTYCTRLLQNDQWEFKGDYPFKF